jgi:hypothetical protein
LIIIGVELYSIFAVIVSNSDDFFDLIEICPRINVLYNLFDWELELNSSLFLEAFPFFPVLQPLSEEVKLVGVDVSII